MIQTNDFIEQFPELFPKYGHLAPWEILAHLPALIHRRIAGLDTDFNIKDGIAIHKTAVIEAGVMLKSPVIIGAHCFVGSHAYLRGGVCIGSHTTIGPGCEIKTSIIGDHSALAHFNFIGDSILGSHVNFEAGAVIANHHNDRADKHIHVVYKEEQLATEVDKFGALVGDHVKVGANAVLSPGTLLLPQTIVGRLELVDQQQVNVGSTTVS